MFRLNSTTRIWPCPCLARLPLKRLKRAALLFSPAYLSEQSRFNLGRPHESRGSTRYLWPRELMMCHDMLFTLHALVLDTDGHSYYTCTALS